MSLSSQQRMGFSFKSNYAVPKPHSSETPSLLHPKQTWRTRGWDQVFDIEKNWSLGRLGCKTAKASSMPKVISPQQKWENPR